MNRSGSEINERWHARFESVMKLFARAAMYGERPGLPPHGETADWYH